MSQIEGDIAAVELAADSDRERAAATELSGRWARYRATTTEIAALADTDRDEAIARFQGSGISTFNGVEHQYRKRAVRQPEPVRERRRRGCEFGDLVADRGHRASARRNLGDPLGNAAAPGGVPVMRRTHQQPQQLSRRTFLAGLGAAGLGAAGLVGCGTEAGSAPSFDLGNSSRLTMLNWPDYIDLTSEGRPGTIERIQAELNLEVDYLTDYEDNYAGYELVLANAVNVDPPQYDIVVPTNWRAGADDRARLGPNNLPIEEIPNHVNLDPAFMTNAWDRGSRYQMPWQAGITGIAFDPALTGRPLGSIEDLFDPEFAGRIGLIGEMREAVGLAMLANGDDPSRPTSATVEAGYNRIADAVESGQFTRATYGDFADRIVSGELAAAMAWSGDTALLRETRPDIEFVIPEQGAIQWFDTMVIPVGSEKRRRRRSVHELRLRADERGPNNRVGWLYLAGARRAGSVARRRWRSRRVGPRSASLPRRVEPEPVVHLGWVSTRPTNRRRRCFQRADRSAARRRVDRPNQERGQGRMPDSMHEHTPEIEEAGRRDRRLCALADHARSDPPRPSKDDRRASGAVRPDGHRGGDRRPQGARAFRRGVGAVVPVGRLHPLPVVRASGAHRGGRVVRSRGGAFSIYGGSWIEGAGAVYAENEALRWLSDRCGLPAESGGVFVPGGTIGNLSALVGARGAAEKRLASAGVERPAKWAFVVSSSAHSSVPSAAAVMDAEVIKVDTGPDRRLTGDLVSAALDEHGHRVAGVVATAGTTNLGIIDDLTSVGTVCHDRDVFFHVDAAYGGGALTVPSARGLFDGIELADSVIIDPHKWLFAPFDCCALLWRDPDQARAVHAQHAGYLEFLDSYGDWNPSDFAIHLTRRARGLPFWFSLATYGTDAYAEAIESTIELAREAVGGSRRPIISGWCGIRS